MSSLPQDSSPLARRVERLERQLAFYRRVGLVGVILLVSLLTMANRSGDPLDGVVEVDRNGQVALRLTDKAGHEARLTAGELTFVSKDSRSKRVLHRVELSSGQLRVARPRLTRSSSAKSDGEIVGDWATTVTARNVYVTGTDKRSDKQVQAENPEVIGATNQTSHALIGFPKDDDDHAVLELSDVLGTSTHHPSGKASVNLTPKGQLRAKQRAEDRATAEEALRGVQRK